MKKLKLTGKLSLNKETVARLSDSQMNDAKGGKNFLSLGRDCSTINDTACGAGGSQTCQLFCIR
ncbi:MAG: class I lanthipeptide [Flavobacteriaceae bacterium]|nr:class I lanthipeptide [Flavobacteriaceae bacterium]